MRTLVAYYFSATGHTKRALTALTEALRGHGVSSTLLPIEEAGEAPSVDADMLCVAYPVHGFNAPVIVERFVRSLPAGEGRYCFIVKSSGEPLRVNNASSLRLVRTLRAKGYRFGAEFHYVMPYNIIFRHSDDMVALMRETLLHKVVDDAALVAEEGVRPMDVPVKARLVCSFVRIEHPAMPLIGKGFRVDKNKCVDCMKCVNACPTHNITKVNGKFKFGNHCLGCMRCSFLCPRSAIKIGILGAWKVNGRYDFDGATKSERPIVPRYCHNSYLRYFGLNPTKQKKD